MRRWYSVHVPAWHEDSHVGDYATLTEAIEAAKDVSAPHRGEVQIYHETEIHLFGWMLSHVHRLANWETGK